MNFNITDETFDFIADKLTDFLIISDLMGNIIKVNKALLQFLNCKKDDLINKPTSVIFGDPFKTMKHGHPDLIYIEYKDIKVPLRLTSSLIFDKNEIPMGTLIVARDMTETRKLTSDIKKLKKNIKDKQKETTTTLSFLSDAVASVGESVFLVDFIQRIIYCNSRASKTFGYVFEEIIGKSPEMLYKTDDIRSFKGNWKGEVMGVKKDGTSFPALLTTSTVKNKSGKEIGVVGVFRDISELKILVKELERASADMEKRVLLRTQELEASKTQWERTFNSIEDMVSIHSIEDKIVRVNKALARKFNVLPSKLEGRECCSLLLDENYKDCPCNEVLQTKRTVHKEIESKKLEGTYTFTVSPILNEKGQIEGMVHIITDVTKRKNLEMQLLQSSKMAAIGTLTAGIAHELNNPLTVIMGYTHLILNDPAIDNIMKVRLKKIYDQCERAKKIIYNLLVFSRSYKSAKQYVNICDLVDKTLELRSYELKVKNISVIQNFEKQLPSMYVDAHQLQQVFLNLINNAVDAILSVKESGKISIDVTKKENKIHLVFSDDGAGIDHKNISKIFDPFYTTKEVGKGTGLGLSISYGIIKEHNGNIIVNSRPGEGTDFIIEIPINPVVSDMDKENKIHFNIKGTAFKGNILVLDDESMVLEIITSYLEQYGFTIETFLDGEAALNRIKEKDFDIIISDYRMPNIDGKRLYNRLVSYNPELIKRLIYITGDISDSSIFEFIKNTGIKFLNKPFDMSELLKIINEIFTDSSHF